MKARIAHNCDVDILNDALRIDLGIGPHIARGNLAMAAGSIVGEAVGHELAKHVVEHG